MEIKLLRNIEKRNKDLATCLKISWTNIYHMKDTLLLKKIPNIIEDYQTLLDLKIIDKNGRILINGRKKR
jgi:hypothetical protein